MKLTRYGQSCVLIETKDQRILVDPGIYHYEESLLENGWNNIDLILITHKHGDHCHIEALKKIVERDHCNVQATQEVADHYPEFTFEITKQDDVIDFNGIKIEIVNAVHGFLPFLKGGNEVNENIGYIVDDGEKI